MAIISQLSLNGTAHGFYTFQGLDYSLDSGEGVRNGVTNVYVRKGQDSLIRVFLLEAILMHIFQVLLIDIRLLGRLLRSSLLWQVQ